MLLQIQRGGEACVVLPKISRDHIQPEILKLGQCFNLLVLLTLYAWGVWWLWDYIFNFFSDSDPELTSTCISLSDIIVTWIAGNVVLGGISFLSNHLT